MHSDPKNPLRRKGDATFYAAIDGQPIEASRECQQNATKKLASPYPRAEPTIRSFAVCPRPGQVLRKASMTKTARPTAM